MVEGTRRPLGLRDKLLKQVLIAEVYRADGSIGWDRASGTLTDCELIEARSLLLTSGGISHRLLVQVPSLASERP